MIGILITMLALASGTGYFILSAPEASLVVENAVAPAVENLSAEIPAPAAAEVVKTVEEQTTEAMEQAKEPMAENSQPTKTVEADEPKKPAASDDAPSIRNRLVSFGYAEGSGRSIDTAVLHSSYNNQGGDRYSVDKVIDIWKSYDVAPHYMIDRKGTIYRLVEDEDIAYHAGNSKMPDGRTDVNKFSIGIEILNDEDDGYTSAQYDSVNALVAYLGKKHGVKYVVGHDDIAPGRKTDPWNFDWKKLK